MGYFVDGILSERINVRAKLSYTDPLRADAITIPAPARRITAPTIGETGMLSFFSATASIGPISSTFSCLVKVI